MRGAQRMMAFLLYAVAVALVVHVVAGAFGYQTFSLGEALAGFGAGAMLGKIIAGAFG